jgi:hypothetical protein
MGGLEGDPQRQAGSAFLAPLLLEGREDLSGFRGRRALSSFQAGPAILSRSLREHDSPPQLVGEAHGCTFLSG